MGGSTKAAFIAIAVALVGAGGWFILRDPSPTAGKVEGSAAKAGTDRSAADDDRPVFDDEPVFEGGGSLDARVAKLEREVDSLRRQLAITRGASTVMSGDDDDAAEVPAQFDDAVRAVLEEERSREREEEAERRRDRWESRSEEILDELVSQAGINASQRETIGSLWSAEREKAGPIFMAAREGDKDFSEAREEIEALRKQTDAEVAKLLSSEQYTAYEELRPRGGGRGGGGWGGGGGR